MAHHRMVKAVYDEEAGTSTVALSSQYGVFEHTVKVHENDMDVKNRFDGMNIAEGMCVRDILKARMQTMRIRLDEAKHLYEVLCRQACAPLEYNYQAVDAIEQQVRVAERNYEKAKRDYEKTNENIGRNVHNLPKMRRQIRNTLEASPF